MTGTRGAESHGEQSGARGGTDTRPAPETRSAAITRDSKSRRNAGVLKDDRNRDRSVIQKMIQRFIRRYPAYVIDGTVDCSVMGMFAELRETIDTAETAAVAELRRVGYSWVEIGAEYGGMAGNNAQRKWDAKIRDMEQGS